MVIFHPHLELLDSLVSEQLILGSHGRRDTITRLEENEESFKNMMNDHQERTKKEMSELRGMIMEMGLQVLQQRARIGFPLQRNGQENVATDALSRVGREENHVTFQAIATCQSNFLNDIQQTWRTDPQLATLIQEKELDPMSHHHYSWEKMILKRKGKLRNKLLDFYYASAIGGHLGVHVTYQRISYLVYWKGLHSIFKQFIKACDICQRNKYETLASPGLLQPFYIPE
ncbi:hypothetical protein ACH5RR_034042 [Cinchona calisaya]|uniref:Integrase zinc-binding domain-containing protein n=1 Tax=Cinchona calisaya TaxID=153742 RepID=A0ABD2Y9R4_9GENT